MIAGIVELSVKWRGLVAIVAVVILIGGVFLLRTLPIDAIPDLSDPQVIVFTEFPGQAPQVVEDQITYPLVTALLTVPRARVVRGQSMFGLSFVYVLFDEGTDLYPVGTRRNRCRLGLPVRCAGRGLSPR